MLDSKFRMVDQYVKEDKLQKAVLECNDIKLLIDKIQDSAYGTGVNVGTGAGVVGGIVTHIASKMLMYSAIKAGETIEDILELAAGMKRELIDIQDHGGIPKAYEPPYPLPVFRSAYDRWLAVKRKLV